MRKLKIEIWESKPKQLMAELAQAFKDISVSTNTALKLTMEDFSKEKTHVEFKETDNINDNSAEDNKDKTVLCKHWR